MPRIASVRFATGPDHTVEVAVVMADGTEEIMSIRSPTGSFEPSRSITKVYYSTLVGQVIDSLIDQGKI